MPNYVDGFVIPIPKKNVEAYRKLALLAKKVWLDHGALEYFECVGEEMNSEFGIPFPVLAKTKPSETVVFAWVVYKSKAARNRIMKKVMDDPRLQDMDKKMPFDVKRMTYGGFDVLVKGHAE